MYTLLAQNGKQSYSITEFYCDTPEDITSLPPCNMGSKAFIISTGEVYMINSQKEWILQQTAGGSGGTGANGKSAYEIAKSHGFIGTETEWLKSLQGASPTIGENGHWFVGETDTGIVAEPELAGYYSADNLAALTDNEIEQICQ